MLVSEDMNIKHSQANQRWRTPGHIIGMVHEVLGGIDLLIDLGITIAGNPCLALSCQLLEEARFKVVEAKRKAFVEVAKKFVKRFK